jgi:hypothetical protein
MLLTHILQARPRQQSHLMIRYALKCEQSHRFESWFGSSADFDRLDAAGLISCAVCGSTQVEKELMAPRIGGGTTAGPPAPALSAPESPAEAALLQLRRRIEAEAENVGRRFVAEARRIHRGEAPERAIIGEARPREARELIEEGIAVAPLPWSSGKSN